MHAGHSAAESPRIATTDFYQVGASYQIGRASLTTDTFLIDRSNEQVYIPDDGSFELKGPSRRTATREGVDPDNPVRFRRRRHDTRYKFVLSRNFTSGLCR